jgi:dephospho-CoA kinase
MLKLNKIAVTGGLSAGKTTVCQLFKELGAYVVSADEIVHQLLSPGTPTAQQVLSLLGPDILSGKQLDRAKIAAVVFSQRDLLTALEKIIHPAVFNEIERLYQQVAKEEKYPLFIAEIPLLYEARAEKRFDAIISVVAKEDLCRHRFSKQKSGSIQEFDQRMQRQSSPEYKLERADYNIENSGTLEQLKGDVQTLFTTLTK